jgi:hypothetical protein
MFSDEDLDVRKVIVQLVYQRVIRNLNNTQCLEKLQDGFWIFRRALTTTADVAPDCISWWT